MKQKRSKETESRTGVRVVSAVSAPPAPTCEGDTGTFKEIKVCHCTVVSSRIRKIEVDNCGKRAAHARTDGSNVRGDLGRFIESRSCENSVQVQGPEQAKSQTSVEAATAESNGSDLKTIRSSVGCWMRQSFGLRYDCILHNVRQSSDC